MWSTAGAVCLERKRKSSFFFRFLSIPITLSTKEHWRKMHATVLKNLMRASCLSIIRGIQQSHGCRAYLTSPEEQNLNLCSSSSSWECAVSKFPDNSYTLCNWRNTKVWMTFVEGLKTLQYKRFHRNIGIQKT